MAGGTIFLMECAAMLHLSSTAYIKCSHVNSILLPLPINGMSTGIGISCFFAKCSTFVIINMMKDKIINFTLMLLLLVFPVNALALEKDYGEYQYISNTVTTQLDKLYIDKAVKPVINQVVAYTLYFGQKSLEKTLEKAGLSKNLQKSKIINVITASFDDEGLSKLKQALEKDMSPRDVLIFFMDISMEILTDAYVAGIENETDKQVYKWMIKLAYIDVKVIVLANYGDPIDRASAVKEYVKDSGYLLFDIGMNDYKAYKSWRNDSFNSDVSKVKAKIFNVYLNVSRQYFYGMNSSKESLLKKFTETCVNDYSVNSANPFYNGGRFNNIVRQECDKYLQEIKSQDNQKITKMLNYAKYLDDDAFERFIVYFFPENERNQLRVYKEKYKNYIGFVDVDKRHWVAKYLFKAAFLGVDIHGYDGGVTFGLENGVSNAEALKLIHNEILYYSMPSGNGLEKYYYNIKKKNPYFFEGMLGMEQKLRVCSKLDNSNCLLRGIWLFLWLGHLV
ncbi:hypothetical protein [Candidatus Thiothrix anitrata]|uniref:Uncharacterized protein n=1 Tax=Candidatus Thiothrix anitrata TaxID=2823902 RepID=A0ABX7X241_9GAMM|nr:hypothetical protein [Candidatus Thiothrix anitrata]QTR48678.1 hypothetical protein J8380_10240 [Candidatus Thiothrix anitrata]